MRSADRALTFVRDESRRAEPFWLSLNYTAPHYPWIDAHPREYTDLYAGCAFESCPQERPHPWTAYGNPATDEGFRRPRESLIGYFAATTAMDAGIARVLRELDKLEPHAKHARDLHERQRHELRPARHLGQGQRHPTAEHVRHVGQGALPHRTARPYRARRQRCAAVRIRSFRRCSRTSALPIHPRARGRAGAFPRCWGAGRCDATTPSWSTTNTGPCGWCARASGSTCTATPTVRTSCTT